MKKIKSKSKVKIIVKNWKQSQKPLIDACEHVFAEADHSAGNECKSIEETGRNQEEINEKESQSGLNQKGLWHYELGVSTCMLLLVHISAHWSIEHWIQIQTLLLPKRFSRKVRLMPDSRAWVPKITYNGCKRYWAKCWGNTIRRLSQLGVLL